MALLDKLAIGNTVSFQVYPDGVIPHNYEHVKVMAILDSESVRMHNQDPLSLHRAVYSFLPTDTPDDPSMYSWVKVKHLNGKVSLLGLPWIREDTASVVGAGVLSLKVPDVGAIEQERILTALRGLGHRPYDVKLT